MAAADAQATPFVYLAREGNNRVGVNRWYIFTSRPPEELLVTVKQRLILPTYTNLLPVYYDVLYCDYEVKDAIEAI